MGDHHMAMRVIAIAILCVCAQAAFHEDTIPEAENVMPISASENYLEAALVQHEDEPHEHKLDPNEEEGHAMFLPSHWKIPKVPAEAGNEARFHKETESQHTSAMEALNTAHADNEKARGLSIVNSIMKKREAADKIKNEDHVVAEKMNLAAEKAAVFKQSVAAFDKEKVVVQKAMLEVKAQAAVVEGFKKQLKLAEALLKKKKAVLQKAMNNKLHSKYLMEVSANKYKTAKTTAIKLDKKAQERRAKTKQMRYYAKVAEKAVEAAEHAKKHGPKTEHNKHHTKKAAKHGKAAAHHGYGGAHKKAVKHANKAAKHANKICVDCTKLPKAYMKQIATYSSGGVKKAGSCKDCGLWAADGYCSSKKFSAFMAKYCRGSCHKKFPKAKNCGA